MDSFDPLMEEGGRFTVDSDLLLWVRDRITLPGYSPDMFKEQFNMQVSDFLASKLCTKLILYLDEKECLCVKTNGFQEIQKVKEFQYFIKGENEVIFTREKIAAKVHYGVIYGGVNAFDSLMRLMNSYYLSSFLTNNSWPVSVRTEFSGQVHRFMASLTETSNQVKGHTVLYIPEENLSDLEKASKDKDLVQRLEAILIHWTRQIKEVVSNQDNSQVESIGPLQEISFWRSRCIDLSGIRSQLERSGLFSCYRFYYFRCYTSSRCSKSCKLDLLGRFY